MYIAKNYDFSIISNNCWSTRIYQKFGLPYLSPFANLFIFAPDYITLLEHFSLENLQLTKFIPHEESKYKKELIEQNIFNTPYPIGVLIDGTELHFLHYKTEEDAREKWKRRIKRINPNKMIFKFSDGNNSTDELIERFKGQKRVELEWKYSHRYFKLHNFINEL